MRKILNEIVVIRPIIILSLVLYHTLCIYNGSWSKPPQISSNDTYFWISKLIFGCTLEAFVFVSGYVYGFQSEKQIQTFSSFILKKANRLLIPCYFWGVLYYIIILYDNSDKGLFVFKTIIEGAGHLWFLPMLFWCFLIMRFCQRFINISDYNYFIFFSFVSLLPNFLIFHAPFGLSRIPHFFFYFYLGYFIWQFKDRFFNVKTHTLCFLVLLYLTLTILLVSILRYGFIPVNHSLQAVICWTLDYFQNMAGILALYLTVNKYYSNRLCSNILLRYNSWCFGIYIVHQFVLKYLYYKTDYLNIIDESLLPFISFFICVAFSILFVKVLSNSRFGKKMLS